MGYSFVQIKEYNAGTSYSISSVAAHVGANTTYTGSFANDLAGHSVNITGLAASNNGTFTVQSNTSTTMVVNNGSGTAQTAVGTAAFPSIDPTFVQITPTIGNFLVVIIWVGNSSAQTVSGVSDTFNAYSNCTGTHVNNGSVNSGTSLDMWYAPVTTGGLLTVSATWPTAAGTGYSYIAAIEYSGVTSFDFGSNTGGSQTTPSITFATATSNELMIWAVLDNGFTTITWNQATITSRTSIVNGGPVGNSSYSIGEQPNPQYYTVGSTTFGATTNIIMSAAAFKTNSSVANALSPYIGYGSYDNGGVALPAQEPTSAAWANQFNFLPAPIAGGSKGPTNSGSLYQGAGAGATSGFGQIYPTGREPIG